MKPNRLVVSGVLSLVLVPSAALAAPFGIASLGSTGSAVVDHDSLTGDDRGGIAVSTSQVFYTGDARTARFSRTNLTGGAATTQRYDSMAGNLATGDVYVFGTASGQAIGGSTATRLLAVNASTGELTGSFITLSHSIDLVTNSGIFSGSGRIVVHTGSYAYSIALPSGTVTDLGTQSPIPYYGCESYFFWGVVEEMGADLYVVYRHQTSHKFVRTRLGTGTTTLVASFTNLSDLCSFTVSPSQNRWFFHYEGSSQFGGSFETVGYADASFTSSFPDGDGDGLPNLADNCPSDANADQLDEDEDWVGDACDPCPQDPDTDGDAVCVPDDNCPNVANPGQQDADGDDFGDACDTCVGPGASNSDSDTVCNGFDNCQFAANEDQADLDSDGQGDVCDNLDNTLLIRVASIKAKVGERKSIVKGSLNEPTPFHDTPDATDGFVIEVYDNALSYLAVAFDSTDCVESATQILCETPDGLALLKIKIKAEAAGKVPFLVKMKNADGIPPLFQGPITMYMSEGATSVDREGTASVCSTTPSKVVCK